MKTSCKNSQALLDQYIMGDLSSDELEQLQTHLEDCAHCQQVLEGETWEQHLLDLPRYKCPDRIIRKIDAMIQSEKQRSHAFKPFRWYWRQTVIAGFALAMTVAIFMIRTGKTPTIIQPQYTEEDMEKAKQVMKWTMVYTAQKIKQSEARIIEEVYANHLSASVQKSVRKVLPLIQGESP